MKNLDVFVQLSDAEMQSTIGGYEEKGLVEEIAYLLGATAKSIKVFCTTAMEYQASLPANLKK